ncbi:MAG: MFS transporter, partial [Demequina sp.]|uniref:MFS transporter n=1 Tax=Demequina sp. TaxID=2050685 RepID=UPI003A83EBAC
SAASGAGTAVGVILGGLLTGYLSWRAVMFVNVPVGIAAVVGARVVLTESPRRAVRIDWWGGVLGSLGVTAAVFAITQSGEAARGWAEPTVWVAAALAVLLLVAFLMVEASHPAPILPLGIFRDRSRSAALGAVMLLGFALSMTYFQSLFVQQVLGYTPTRAGLAFLPTAVGLAVGSWVAARLLARMPIAAVSCAGVVLGAIGVALMARWDAASSYAPDILAPVLVWALGTGLAFVPLTLAVVTGVSEREAGAVSAVMGMLQQVGGAVGLAVLVAVASGAQGAMLADAPARLGAALAVGDDALVARARDAIAAGGSAAFAMSAAALLFAAALVGLWVRGSRPSAVGRPRAADA